MNKHSHLIFIYLLEGNAYNLKVEKVLRQTQKTKIKLGKRWMNSVIIKCKISLWTVLLTVVKDQQPREDTCQCIIYEGKI